MAVEQIRILLNNTWYLEPDGFKKGYVFIDGFYIKSTGEEPEPEYELSELQYDFNGYGIVIHGYSVVIDTLEYFFKGFKEIDYSIFTRQELKKIMEATLLRSYISGVTLPIIETPFIDIVMDIARENSLKVGVITEEGSGRDTVDRNVFFLTRRNNGLYYGDKLLGEIKEICKPSDVDQECLVIDTRGYGAVSTAIEIVFKKLGDPSLAYRVLTNPYRLLRVDNGFVQASSSADLLIHDLREPLKSFPIYRPEQCYEVLWRTSTPDMVLVNGNVIYERGENLVFSLSKLHEIIGKAVKG